MPQTRIKTGQLDRSKEASWKEEFEVDQVTLDLAAWHIQSLEEQYLQSRSHYIVDQMQFWYSKIHELRNKIYF